MRKRIFSAFITLCMLCALIPALPAQVAEAATNIKVGDYVKMGEWNEVPMMWRCVDIDGNGPLMVAASVLCSKAFDEPGSKTDNGSSHSRDYEDNTRKATGSNYWGDSNIRAWLNSEAAAGKVEYPCGNPPSYSGEAGFLTNFTRDELNTIKEVDQKQVLSEADENLRNSGNTRFNPINYDAYTGKATSITFAFDDGMVSNYDYDAILSNYDQSYSLNVKDRMFLLDIKQFYNMYKNESILGGKDGKFYYPGGDYWLRTPYAGESNNVLFAAQRGYKSDIFFESTNPSLSTVGVRPAFYLKNKITYKYGSGTEDNPYAMKVFTRLQFTGETNTIYLNAAEGEGLTDSLASHMSYENGLNPAGKFKYTITEGNNNLGVKVEGDNLVVPKEALPGEYTIRVRADEIKSQHSDDYSLTSLGEYGFESVTLTYRICIGIRVGDYVQLGKYNDEPILWRCVGIDENGPLMFSDKILCIKPWDAGGYITTGSHGTSYYVGQPNYTRWMSGSNYWGDSTIRSWLNSNAEAGKVEWLCGNPPNAQSVSFGNSYDQEAGFLTNFSEDELRVVKEVTQKSILADTDFSKETMGRRTYSFSQTFSSVMTRYDDAYSVSLNERMFLPDVKQVKMVYDNRNILGENYYKAYPTEKCAENSDFKSVSADNHWFYWLRTPDNAYGSSSSPDYVYVVSYYEKDQFARQPVNYGIVGVRPAFYLNWQDENTNFQSGDGSAESPYTLEKLGYSVNKAAAFAVNEGKGITADLSAYMSYDDGASTKNAFTYEIESGNDTLGASISGDTLTVPTDAKAGHYTLTVKVKEKPQSYNLSAFGKYDRYGDKLTVKIHIYSGADEIKVGDYIQIGTYDGEPILWRCVDIDENGPLMLTDKIVCEKQWDVGSDSAVWGDDVNWSQSHGRRNGWYNESNYWGDSNIRAWLNSDAAAGGVQYPCGYRPYYCGEAGFLNNFGEAELNVIKETEQKAILSYQDFSCATEGAVEYRMITDMNGIISNYDDAYGEKFKDKVFPLDVKQAYAVYANGDILGSDYYIGTKADGEKTTYWLRTPKAGSVGGVRMVQPDGSIFEYAADATYGVRPALYLNTLSPTYSQGSGTAEDPYQIRENTRVMFRKQSQPIGFGAAEGEDITGDLSKYVEYDDGRSVAGKFTYTIVGDNTIDARIDGDILTVPKGLAKGSYKLTVSVEEKDEQYKYQFNMASLEGYGTDPITMDVNIYVGIGLGDYVQMGAYKGTPILWRCVAFDENGPLMLSDKIIGGGKEFDEYGASYTYDDISTSHGRDQQRWYNGSNYWGDSNMRSWLNSDEDSVRWLCGFSPVGGRDPYAGEHGFLQNFDGEERNVIKTVTQKTILPDCDYREDGIGQSGTESYQYTENIDDIIGNYYEARVGETEDSMFLLDVNQLYAVYKNSDILGEGYYIGADESETAAGVKGTYWLRTPNTDNGTKVRRVNSSGAVVSASAREEGSAGVRPAFYLDTENFNCTQGTGDASDPYWVRETTSVPYAGESDEILLAASSENGLEADLSKYMDYQADTVDTAGKFTYVIMENEDNLGAEIDGDMLVIPPGTANGVYTLSIDAYEKEPQSAYNLASLGDYGFDGRIPLTVKVFVGVAVGDYLQMGMYNGQPILWRCVGVDENGPLMLSDKILSTRQWDVGGDQGSHVRNAWYNSTRQQYGSNFWEDSNMRSWLNSTADAGNVEWLCGNPPNKGAHAYDKEAGFLNGFADIEIDNIKKVTQKTILGNCDVDDYKTSGTDWYNMVVDINGILSNYDSANAYELEDTIFLLDTKQVKMVYDNSDILGDGYYIGEDISSTTEGEKSNYWLRTPKVDSAGGVRYVQSDGNVVETAANNESGVRPALYLDILSESFSFSEDSGTGTKDSPYLIRPITHVKFAVADNPALDVSYGAGKTVDLSQYVDYEGESIGTAGMFTYEITGDNNIGAEINGETLSIPKKLELGDYTLNVKVTEKNEQHVYDLTSVDYGEYSTDAQKTITFNITVSRRIDVGDYVQMGTYEGRPLLWRCVAIDENGPLMLSDKIICEKQWDAVGTAGSHERNAWYSATRQRYGSNYWADSNIRSWLNSEADWGEVKWLCGNPPNYSQEEGFLTNFTRNEIGAMEYVTQKSILGNCDTDLKTSGTESYSMVQGIGDILANYDIANAEEVEDKVFLLDTKQVKAVYDNSDILGSGYYVGENIADNRKGNYWLRTPKVDSAGGVRYVQSNGNVTETAATGSVGVRPAFYFHQTAVNSAINYEDGNGSSSNPFVIYNDVEQLEFGGESEPIYIYMAPNVGTTVDLTQYLKFEDGTDAAGKFTYEIKENTAGASIDGDTITVPGLSEGEYTLKVKAIEREAQFVSLQSIDEYGTEPVTLTFNIIVPSDIKIGTYVQMGEYEGEPILWRCVGIDENGPLMLADKIICVKKFDESGTAADGSHGRDSRVRNVFGSNYWGDSNIRSWLNSDAEAGQVEWPCGNPPSYGGEAGFLTNFTPTEQNVMRNVTQKSILAEADESQVTTGTEWFTNNNNIDQAVSNYDTAYAEYVNDKMFLLDVKQLNTVYNNSEALGERYYIGKLTAKCAENSQSNQSGKEADAEWPYLIRTPAGCGDNYTGAYSLAVNIGVNGGSLTTCYSYTGDEGIRPAFYMNLRVTGFKSGAGTADSPYLIGGVPYRSKEITSDDYLYTKLGDGVTENLSAYVEYKDGSDTAGRFMYTIETNPIGAKIDGDTLTVPSTLGVGKYTLTVRAEEKDGEQYAHVSGDTYGYEPLTFKITVIVYDKIKVGDYVKMGTYNNAPIIWRCVDIDENGPLMLSDKLLCEKQWDAAGSNKNGSHARNSYYYIPYRGEYRDAYGSNFWEDSNIRSWLNSDAAAGSVEWLCGNRPSYYKEAGFLTNFTSNEIDRIKSVKQKTILGCADQGFITSGGELYDYNKNDYYTPPSLAIDGIMRNYDAAFAYEVEDRMFLPDVKQLKTVYDNRDILGDDYYKGVYTQQAGGQEGNYWLKTPNAWAVGRVMYMAPWGNAFEDAADHGSGIRPAFYLETEGLDYIFGDGTSGDPYQIRENKAQFAADSDPIGLSAAEGEGITADLSQHIAYDNGTDVTDKFTYALDGDNTCGAQLDGSTLTIPKETPYGIYSLRVIVTEKEPIYQPFTMANAEDENGSQYMVMNIRIAIGIEVGDYVQMGEYYGEPILWRCVAIDENGPLMLSDKILCVKPFDAIGGNDSGSHGVDELRRGSYGSNYWSDSNIRSWLNSDAEAGSVEWACGNPPNRGNNVYDQEAGFLTNFKSEEREVMKTVTQKSILATPDFDAGYVNNKTGTETYSYNENINSVLANYDSAYSEESSDTMFLLDTKQLYSVYANRGVLGDDYYIGEPTAACVENNKSGGSNIAAGEKWSYWLRTPKANSTAGVRKADADGAVRETAANNDNVAGIRPAFYLDLQNATLKLGAGTDADPYILSQRIQFGGEGDEIALETDYGKGLTADLSQYTAYENETDTADRFTYTIEGENAIDAKIDGETLIVPTSANAGVYTLTIKADEKTPEYVPASVEEYGFEPITLTLNITVRKIDADMSVMRRNLTYTGNEQNLVTGTVSGGTLTYSMSADGEYTQNIPTGTNAGDYTVWYKVTGDANHSDSEPRNITVTIAKAASTASVTGKTLAHTGSEQELVSGVAVGGTLLYSMSEDGEYTEKVPTAADAGEYTVWYKVTGDENHADIEPQSVTTTIAKNASAVSVTSKILSYTGSEQELVSGIAIGGTLLYSMSENGEYSEKIPTASDAGSYTVWYKVTGDANHSDIAPQQVAVTIVKAESTVSVTSKILSYTGSEQELVSGTAAGGKLVYSMSENGEYAEKVPTAAEAGNYTVWYKVMGDANHTDTEPQSVTATIVRASIEASVTGKTLTYTGSAQELVTGTVKGGKLVYSMSKDGTYTEAVPTGTNVGSYTVWYKVTGDANHDDIAPQSVTATITKTAIEASVTGKALSYTGSAQELVTGTVKGGKLVYSMSKDGEYNEDIPTAVNVGSYTVWYKVIGDDNHTGTEPQSVTAAITKVNPEVTVTGKTLTYTGKAQELVSGSTTAGRLVYSMSENGDYIKTVPTAINAGEYTVWYKVIGGDNYNDTEPKSVTTTISKSVPNVSVKANELVFKDREQYLVTGKTSDGTLLYSMSMNGEYTEKVPKGTEAGEYTVWYKVTGDENHADIAPQSVTVSIRNIESIRIESEPANTTILEGMPFDASGLRVIAECGDGETFEAFGYTLSGYDTSTPGEQTVTVTYAGKTAEFTITVEARSLTGIELTHKPDKLTYYQGDKLDITGMVITAKYDNNTSAFIDINDCEVSGSTDIAGEQTITVTYNGETVEFTVNVLERPEQTQTVVAPLIEIAEFYGGKRAIISCATEDAEIYYTTDGTDPTTSSQKYEAPIELTESAEVKAIAVKSGMDNSEIASESVTVEKVETPVASVPSGETAAGTSIKLLCTTPGAEIYYTLGDDLNEDNYKRYTDAIVITEDTTIRVMAAKRGCVMSDGVTFTYTAISSSEPGENERALIGVEDAICKAGNTFSIAAYMYSEHENVSDFRFTFDFDSSKFEYIGFEPGEDMPATVLSVTAAEDSVTVRAAGEGVKSGEACELLFKAKPDVPVNEYYIPLRDMEVNTVDDSLIDVYYWDGVVSIIPQNTDILADGYFTDAELNIIEDPYDLKGDVTAWILTEAIETPQEGEIKDFDVLIAFYDKDGALVKLSKTDAEMYEEMDLLLTSITIPENAEIDSVKLMVWDDTNTMKPLMEAVPLL